MAGRRGGGGPRQGAEEMISEPRKIGAAVLDEEEVRVLAYVRAERPDLEGPFLANVHQGRREILHRLLQALVRENVAGISSRASWRSGVEKCLEIRLSGRTLLVPVRRTLSFGRFDLGGRGPARPLPLGGAKQRSELRPRAGGSRAQAARAGCPGAWIRSAHLAGVGTRAEHRGRDVQHVGLLRAVGGGRTP